MSVHDLYCKNDPVYRQYIKAILDDIEKDVDDILLMDGKVDRIEGKIDTIDGVADSILTAVNAGFALTGNVSVNDVAVGKTFYSNDFKTKLTGTATVVINKLALTDLVVAPVKDATPDVTAIDIDQYSSGVISWFESDGTTPVAADFQASTVYVAKLTITAKAGYTLRGVDANKFTHTGATTVTNTVDTGDVVITFNATGA
jgi:hypothetical protein